MRANRTGTWKGCTLVPMTRPNAPATQPASGASVIRVNQWIWRSTGPNGRSAASVGRVVVVVIGAPPSLGTAWSFAEVLPGQSDEDGLERRLLHVQIGDGGAPSVGGVDDPRQQPLGLVGGHDHRVLLDQRP